MLAQNGNKETGILRYMELTDLKFIPRRMYYITDTPKGEIRGKHGHYDILLVLCSTAFDQKDYFYDKRWEEEDDYIR